MGIHLKNTLISIIYPIPRFNDLGWTREQLEKWIVAGGGGRHATKFIEGETTHLVCSEKAWQTQHVQIQAALAANAKIGADSNGGGGGGKREVRIVSPDWLETVVRDRHKPNAHSYLWSRLARDGEQEARRAGREAGREGGGARTVQGLLAEVLVESAEKFMSEGEKREVEREVQRRREEVGREARERERERVREKEQAAVFRRQARKAKNEIFSENHHIYMDATGFKYEVLLTKVDTKHNRNERHALTLQLYETNSQPHAYATNLHFAGTARLPTNNVLCCLGSTFAAGLRAFETAFGELTGGEWGGRVGFAVERAGREKRGGGGEVEVEFEKRVFAYYPPVCGLRGVLPERAREVFSEVGPPLVREGVSGGEQMDDIGLWMSGGNGEVTAGGGELFGGGGQEGAGAGAGASEFDQFMSGVVDEIAAGAGVAGEGEGSGAAPGGQQTFDFETAYPFAHDGDGYLGGGLGGDVGAEAGGSFDGDAGAHFDFNFHTPADQAGMAEECGLLPGIAPESSGVEGATQVGATQLAEQAGVRLEALVAGAGAVDAAMLPAGLDLGSSVLGMKRKASPAEAFDGLPAGKRLSPVVDAFDDAEGSLFGGTYGLESGALVAGATPRDAVAGGGGIGIEATIEEQIAREMQAGEFGV
ncbi:hypothetical protein LTR08_002994 [Meristemomyces frigidus]|nr:hypothetical protein LTR08_002994 [Meristemomyces frigidus]